MADGLHSRATHPRTKLVALAVASCFAGAVHANPVGPTVMHGTASFNAVGNALNITNSPNAILNWQGFSIGTGEITRFIQNSAASSVLNRVTGTESSSILGQLLSNGRVLLINPNGVFIGGGAVVDVAGFTASSLKISDADFLAGKFKFTDQVGAARIVNQGIIRTPEGGQVYLIAPSVENSGLITSPTGEVVLAAGKSVELIQQGTPYLRVELTAPDNAAVNVGQVIARGGNIGIYGSTIRNAGVVSATGATVGENGRIVLKAKQDVTLDAGGRVEASGSKGGSVSVQAESGTLLADGVIEAKGSAGRGGAIQVFGERVGLVGYAAVDASGDKGGGTVLVGGDYQGKNPDIQNASRTFVGSGATIKADATSSGDGGKIVVWADGDTRFYGSATANAGKFSGDGGFVEISGKERLSYRGQVQASAPYGRAGTVLFDPTDIEIVSTITGNVTDSSVASGTTTFQETGLSGNLAVDDSSQILASAIVTALTGTNVVITTSSTATGGSLGDITVNAAVTYSSTKSLTLSANHDILVNQTIANGSAGDIGLNAPGGKVNLGAAVSTTGGTISVTGGGVGGIELNHATPLSAGAGTVALNSAVTLLANAVVSGGNVTFSNAVDGGGFSLDANATGTTTFGGAVGGTGALTTLSTNTGGTTAINGGAITTTGNQTYNDAVTLGANTTLAAGAGTITFASTLGAGANALTLTADEIDFTGGAGSVSGSSTLTLQPSADGVPIGVAGGTGTLDLATTDIGALANGFSGITIGRAGGTATTTISAVTFQDPVTIRQPGVAGAIVVNGLITGTGDASVALSSGNGGITFNGVGITTANQNIDLSGPVTLASGAVTLDSGSANISFVGSGSTVNGAQALSLNSTGTTTFGGAVGGTGALTTLTTNTGGATAINGGAITTTGNQTYNDAVTLGANTTLNAGAGDINFVSTLNGGFSLDANATGTTTFGGAVGGTGALTTLSTNTGGTTAINGGAITTTGNQTYNDAVTLGASTVLDAGAGTITFASTLGAGANALTLTADEIDFTGGAGSVSGSSTLTLQPSADNVPIGVAGGTGTLDLATTDIGALANGFSGITIGRAGGTATTTISAVTFQDPVTIRQPGVAGAIVVNGLITGTGDASVALSSGNGGITFNGVGITTANQNIDLSGPVTLASGAVTLDSGSANISFVGSGSTVNGAQALSLNSTGTTTFGGAVGGTGALTTLSTNTGGTTAINGGAITTTGNQTYNDAVTLGASTVLDAGAGTITFASTLGAGANALTLTADEIDFTGGAGSVSGSSTLTLQPSADNVPIGVAGGTGTLDLATTDIGALANGFSGITIGRAGGTATTTISAVTFQDPVTIRQPGVAGAIVVNGLITGTGDASVALSSGSGGITFNGVGVTTANQNIDLSGPVTLASGAVTLDSGSANISFVGSGSTVNGAQALSLNSTGTTTFGGAVGGTGALTTLSTNTGGTTAINGGAITTTGNQTYNDAVTLGANTTLAAGAGTITFASTLGAGANALTLTADEIDFTGGAGSVSGSSTLTLQPSADNVPIGVAGGTGTLDLATTDIGALANGFSGITIGRAGGTATTTISAVTFQDPVTIRQPGVAGAIVVNGLITGTGDASVALSSGNGGITFNGVGITTANQNIDLSGPVTLASGAVTLDSGSANISFVGSGSTVNGAQALSLNSTGTTTFGGAVGGTGALTTLTTNTGGTTAINGGAITTTGNQTYNDAVTLGASTTLNAGAGDINFVSTLNGGFSLDANATGTTTFGGAVGGTGALTTLTTNTGGTTAINGGAITTTGNQTYNDAVTLGANTTLNAGAGDINFVSTLNGGFSLDANATGTTTFGGAVGGTGALTTLTTNTGGTTAINGGAITTTGNQTYNDAVTLGANTTLNAGAGDINFVSTLNGGFSLDANATGTTTFGGAVGGTGALTTLSTNTGGTTAINGGAITTTGNQTYNDAVTLGANTTLAAGAGTITFASTLGAGANALTLTADEIDFTGGAGSVSGSSTLTLQPSADNVPIGVAGGTGTLDLATTDIGALANGFSGITIGRAGGTATTTISAVTFQDPVTIRQPGVAGAIVVNGLITGTGDASVALSSGNGGITFNGVGITTANQNIDLSGPVTLASGAVTLDSGSANISFVGSGSTVNGAQALSLNSTGTTTFGGAVGGTGALTTLSTNTGGTTAINGGAITTTGNQTYNDAVTLGASTVLDAGAGTITFASTLGAGANALTLTADEIDFTGGAGSVSGSSTLTLQPSADNVPIGVAGGTGTLDLATTDIGALANGFSGITIGRAGGTATTTISAVTFQDPVTIRQPGVAGAIVVNGLITGTGDASVALSSGNGGITFNGVGITTANQNIDLSGPVTLASGAVTLDSGSANISFVGSGSTVNGAQALSLNSTGTTTFGGAVGGTGALTTLTTNTGGTTAINGGAITTTGNQTYNDAVTLGANTTLNAGAGDINFVSTLNGGFSLDANATGTTTFGGAVGGTGALTTLTTNTGGTTAINGGAITTTGNQTYNDAVTLGANTTLNAGAGDINFVSTLNGGFSLDANATGTTTFGGAVGGTGALTTLTTNTGGTTAINGGAITTTGNQTYNDAVTLGANTTLNAGAGDINFVSTLNGGFSLDANATGTTTFGGAVGGTGALTTLSTNTGGTTAINGGAITTTGNQTYNDAVTLGANTTLAAGAGTITFASTLGAGANALTLTADEIDFTGGAGSVSGSSTLTLQPSADNVPIGVAGGTGTLDLATTDIGALANGFSGITIGRAGGTATTTISAVTFQDPVTIRQPGVAGAIVVNGLITGTGDASVALSSGNGGITFNGVGITTANQNIDLSGPVTLASGAVTLDSGSANISFVGSGSTVNGAQALSLNSTGTTTFGGAVGGTGALTTLSTNTGGTTAINGGAITTTGNQTYNDAVTLGASTVLDAGAGTITFASTLGAGANALTLTADEIDFTGGAGSVSGSSTLTLQPSADNVPIGVAGGTGTLDLATTDIGALANGFSGITIGRAGGTATTTISAVTFQDPVTIRQPGVAGAIVVNGLITGTGDASVALSSGNGGITFNGVGITTANQNIDLSGPVTLASGAVTLDSGSANISFVGSGSTVNGAQALSLNSTGTTTFGGAVGGTGALTTLSTNTGGTTAINGGAITTTGNQTYNDAVTLGANTTLAAGAGTITFASTLGAGANALTLTADEIDFTGGAGSVSGSSTLTLQPSADNVPIGVAGGTGTLDLATTDIGALANGFSGITIGRAGGTATTTISAVTFQDPVTIRQPGVAGAIVVNGLITGTGDASVALSSGNGGITFNGVGITTANQNIDLSGPVTLASGAVTLDSGSANISFVGSGSTVNGAQALSLNSTGTTTFGGAVGGTGALTTLSTNTGGTTAINGGAITTTGNQTYNDAVTLGANTTLNAGAGDINFVSTLNGGFSLDANATGTTTFGGAVGGTGALTTLSTNTGGTTAINGGAITTTGNQTYNDAVTLGASTTLNAGAGDINFVSTLNGGFSLDANATGTTTFGGAVGGTGALTTLSTNTGGTTAINGGAITTTGNQTYNDAVTLGASTTLNAGAGDINFVSTLNGGFSLDANATGTTTFGGAVGGTGALTTLTTNTGGTTAINGGAITTTGNQTYNDAVTLGANTTLNAGAGDINFVSTLNGGFSLDANATGTTTFGGAVGGTGALTTLSTNTGGTTAINGGAITTTGNQTYNDAVTLGANTTLNAGAGDINFVSTLNGGFSLDANATGTTTFGGAVGGTGALTTLSTNTGGTTAINGGAITTTGNQTYNDAVTLGASTVLDAGAGTITFASTLGAGANALTLTADEIDFTGGAGSVSGSSTLTLQPSADNVPIGVAGGTGTLDLATTDIGALANGFSGITIGRAGGTATTTISAVTFQDPVTIRQPGVAGAIVVNGLITGTGDASVALSSGNGGITFNGVGITTANQNIDLSGPVTLASGAVTLDSGSANISFVGSGSTVNGAQALSLNSTGTTTFGGAVGGTGALTTLTTNTGGTTAINGGAITTTGNQTYNDAVTLGANTTLNAGAGDINFVSTLNGGFSLDANATGTTTFGGAVGGTGALTTLSTNTGGTTAINGGAITTTGNQTYNDAVTLGASTTLNAGAGDINFVSTLNGGFSLDANATGTTTFKDVVGGTLALMALTTDAGGTTRIEKGAVTTTGAQTYGDNVVLKIDTVLIGVANDFKAKIDSDTAAINLTVRDSGNTNFRGAVGTTNALATLTTDAPGTTTINSVAIQTTGAQTYNDPVILAGGATSALDTTNAGAVAAGANVTFASTVSGTTAGADSITIQAGTVGDVRFNSVVGATRVGDIQVLSARNVTTSASVTSRSLATTAIQNQVQLIGPVDTAGNVSLTASGPIATSIINTSAGGSVTFNNASSLTIGGNISADGYVAQTTSGAVALNGDVTTTSDLVRFAAPVTLGGGARTINTSPGGSGGDITFGGSLDGGGNNLTLNAGSSGNINFNGPISNVAALNFLNANNLALLGGFSGGGLILQSNGSGSTTLGGTIVTTGPISITTNGSINVTGQISTNNNPVTFNASDWNFAGGNINTGFSPITISQVSDGTINIGSQLDTADLAALVTSNLYIGGASNAGIVNIDGSANFAASTPNVTLRATGSGGKLTQTNPGAIVGSPSTLLTLVSDSGIGSTAAPMRFQTTGTNTVTNVSADNASVGDIALQFAGGDVRLTGPFTDAAPGGAIDVSTSNGAINTVTTVSSQGRLALTASSAGAAAPLNIESNGVTAKGGITLRSADALTIASGEGLRAGGNVTLIAGVAPGMTGANAVTSVRPAFAPQAYRESAVLITGPVHATGDITIESTGSVTQSVGSAAGLQASTGSANGRLTVVTFNDAGAPVILKNDSTTGTGNCAGATGIGNCAGTVQIEARFADGRITEFAAADIDYQGISGISVQSLGTGTDARLVSPSVTLPTSNIVARNASFYATGGNIDLEAQIANGNINKGLSGGSLNLYAQGNVNVSAPTSPTSAGVSIGRRASVDAHGTVTAEPFKHDLTLTATGDVNITGSIYMAPDRDLNLRADASIGEVAPSLIPGAPSLGDGAGSVKLATQPASHYGTEGSMFPLEVKARNIVIGKRQGSLLFPVQNLEINTTLPGLPKDGSSQRADALLSASENLEVYLTGDLKITAGSTQAVTTATTQKLQSTAVAAMEGKDVFIRGVGTGDFGALPKNNTSIFLTAGSAMADNGVGGDAFAAADAAIIASSTKTIDIGGDMWLQGGTTIRRRNVDASLLNLVSAQAFLDPATMNIATGGNIVLIGGLGSNASAKILNSGDVKLAIRGHGPVTFFNPLTEKMETVPNGGLVIVGGPGSGVFDSFDNPIGLQAPPVEASFPGGGGYTLLNYSDRTMAAAYIQSGPTRNFDDLLSYILYAANQETQVTRIRAGVSSKDDGNLPSCN